MKKKIETKKMTIDKLAIMMNNGFESIESRMATKDDIKGLKNEIEGVKKNVNDIRKDVSSNTKVSNLMLKEISAIHEDNKRFRETVASLNMDGVSYNRRIENLTIRVEKLEIKK
ncbi:hypothetical protein A2738_01675 [Candidatus Nomurabacteria bacterium RIFCSPHIGHO2_01_FULL_42_15]|uniref:Uncharacterized protein n=1 Tax=Candidatus Nomurabacteria bacterium RIFCSPHIGHO2_01_FULL_42_15 TaxID=1801742 RepID=A0A1F6VG25_9BACT|nr:MAG: hypothetical protein A2738_01675 [Candidatus Nomurabacteria bacterium RIFCSPHIGHO2_01_FULL_42_15]OGI93004.1 MAG: hypothetical protein A3A99_00495 [Candidatus Nomurabacteria bacterium RIFCSPLOWO2_01_FULL_41_18]